MTPDQIGIIALLAGMFVVYASERFRVELVALCGLAVAFAAGLVPLTSVFAGFSNPAVITVVEILLVVSVLARTRAGVGPPAEATRPGGCHAAESRTDLAGARAPALVHSVGDLGVAEPGEA